MRDRRRRRPKHHYSEYSSARDKVKFMKHLTSYVIVNVMMLALNFYMGTARNWLPVIFFWGIGLAFHYVKAYGFGKYGMGSKDWKRRMLNTSGEDSKEYDDYLELKELEKEKDKRWKDEDLV